MDMNAIVSVISTVGFPVTMCGVLAWYIKDSNDKYDKQLSEINDKHQSEIKSTTDAINNNTLAITLLCEKLK